MPGILRPWWAMWTSPKPCWTSEIATATPSTTRAEHPWASHCSPVIRSHRTQETSQRLNSRLFNSLGLVGLVALFHFVSLHTWLRFSFIRNLQDYTQKGREQIVDLLREHKATESTTYRRPTPTGPIWDESRSRSEAELVEMFGSHWIQIHRFFLSGKCPDFGGRKIRMFFLEKYDQLTWSRHDDMLSRFTNLLILPKASAQKKSASLQHGINKWGNKWKQKNTFTILHLMFTGFFCRCNWDSSESPCSSCAFPSSSRCRSQKPRNPWATRWSLCPSRLAFSQRNQQMWRSKDIPKISKSFKPSTVIFFFRSLVPTTARAGRKVPWQNDLPNGAETETAETARFTTRKAMYSTTALLALQRCGQLRYVEIHNES